ncbi:hypothetical protein BH23PLA1_BH23PLA1_37310 [soil metagenome]
MHRRIDNALHRLRQDLTDHLWPIRDIPIY